MKHVDYIQMGVWRDPLYTPAPPTGKGGYKSHLSPLQEGSSVQVETGGRPRQVATDCIHTCKTHTPVERQKRKLSPVKS